VDDVLGSSATTMRPFEIRSWIVGVDLRDGVALGHFDYFDATRKRLRGSILSLGVLHISEPDVSDFLGVGTRYESWSGTRLSARYPLHESRNISDRYRATLAVGERVELQADFISADALSAVERTIHRRNVHGYGSYNWSVVSSAEIPLSGKTRSVREVFEAAEPGIYSVVIKPPVFWGPDGSRQTTSATWEFRVEGAICGDGVLEPPEACDDGPYNSDTTPSACRTSCTFARCGDGVVDLGESCDEGSANSNVNPDATCRRNCALATCGNDAIDEGEQCDDGAGNDDALPDACRTTCVLAHCGDGVIDSGEVCDEGAANSDVTADACRRDCTPPRCGDGVVDSGEFCDSGVGCLENCQCPPNCYPLGGNGCFCLG
jgi:hypothetical protein